MRNIASLGLLSAGLCLTFALRAGGAQGAGQVPPRPTAAQPASSSPGQGEHIVAIVNGDVISQGDVDARGRLFALSTGMGLSPDVLARLRPQVTQQLIDERLRLQEEQRRKIVVSDKEIADAVNGIEQRNGMGKGALRASLGAEGVALRTLYDQTRVQLGWTRVLREELGPRADISDADVAAQQAVLKAEAGQAEYHVGEIFLPINDPAKATDTQRFADTVIGQLRAGAPFSVVAAQFSQSQTALQGGDLGWVHLNQLDPQVVAILKEMPDGAVSNPIRVPGGISIVTLRGTREVGRDIATKSSGSPRPADPGDVRLEGLAGPMRALLTGLQPEQVSRPLVSTDGIGLVMVCSKDQKNVADGGNKDEIGARLLNERVELVSRQLVRDLRRRAIIDMRG
jgi:peptidyl-prolyl cis-trans isomerase SurA